MVMRMLPCFLSSATARAKVRVGHLLVAMALSMSHMTQRTKPPPSSWCRPPKREVVLRRPTNAAKGTHRRVRAEVTRRAATMGS